MATKGRSSLVLTDIHKRVVNAKYILDRANGIQREGQEMGVAISLLLMHDAVELLMHAVIDHLGLTKKFEFMSFWATIKGAGHPEPPDYTTMAADLSEYTHWTLTSYEQRRV